MASFPDIAADPQAQTFRDEAAESVPI